MDRNKEIGLRIEAARKEKKMSLQDVAEKVSIARSTVQRYEQGKIVNVKLPVVEAIANAVGVSPAWVLGKSFQKYDSDAPLPSNIHPVKKVRYIPRVGRIACGTPILAEENIQGYVLLPDGVKADFVLDCAGDSMIDAAIDDGDTVFIRKQPEVENGEIAAVLIGEEATLKRVYWNGNTLTLMPANKDFAPLTYAGEEMEGVRVLGKATAVLKLL